MRTKTTTMFGTVTLLSCVALVGCASGHGKHTQEFQQQAMKRMDGVKAATNWDMAHQQFLSGDLDKALRTVDISIAHNDNVSKSHMLRGRIMLELDRLEASIASMARAIELGPDDGEPHYYMGIIHERLSASENALESYRTAAALDSANPQYTLAAAEMMIQLDRLPEAKELLLSASSTFEHNAGVRQTLGHIAMMQNDVPGAVRHFEDACLLGPDDAGLLEDLAGAQLQARDFSGAEYTLRRMMSLGSVEQADIERQLTLCLIELDRPVEARDLLVKRVMTDAGAADIEAWIDLGGVCLQTGDRFRLRQAGGRVTSMAPNRPDGYMLTAWWHHLEGKTDRAIALLEGAKDLTGEFSDLAILQSVILSDANRPQEAMQLLHDAWKVDPSDQRLAQMASRIERDHAVADVPID